jgi:hypothetical protein
MKQTKIIVKDIIEMCKQSDKISPYFIIIEKYITKTDITRVFNNHKSFEKWFMTRAKQSGFGMFKSMIAYGTIMRSYQLFKKTEKLCVQ